jgi:hypothetical protein
MQTVKPEITEEFALVDQDILEILILKGVDQFHHQSQLTLNVKLM